MTLKNLNEQLKSLNHELCEKRAQVIDEGCEKLLVLLQKFADYHENDIPIISKHNGGVWINLKRICRIGIRYCGHFINAIIIKSDESIIARNRIKLTYVSYEDEEDFKSCACYKCDSYFGESGDAIPYIEILNDWENFRNLIYSLMPFFKNTDTILKDKYTQACIDIDKFYSKETSKIKDKLDYLQEDIDEYFDKVFERFKNYNNKNKKHFLLLPDNLSLRYHGRFHNCLIKDNYSISLGFLKHQNFIAEEGYNQDDYTIENDLNRYNHEDYILLHETSLNVYHESYLETNRVLKDLIFLCGEDLQSIPEDNYLQSENVKFIHTLLTD